MKQRVLGSWRMITGFFLEIENFALCFLSLEKSLFLLMGLFVSTHQFSLQFSIFDERSTQSILINLVQVFLSPGFDTINNEHSKSFEISSQQIIVYSGLFGLFIASIWILCVWPTRFYYTIMRQHCIVSMNFSSQYIVETKWCDFLFRDVIFTTVQYAHIRPKAFFIMLYDYSPCNLRCRSWIC